MLMLMLNRVSINSIDLGWHHKSFLNATPPANDQRLISFRVVLLRNLVTMSSFSSIG